MKNADLRQLALLCELIDTQSLSEAAERLHMTASAASHALGRLRAELGDEVCVREQQRYLLTPFGEASLEPFRQIVNLWREASSTDWLFDAARCEARVSLACHEGVGGLADFCRDTLALAPRLTLDLGAPSDGPRDIEELRAGTVDLVCGLQEAPADARDLHMDTLGRWPLVFCCLSAEHPRIADTLSLKQYLAEEHLGIGALQRPGGLPRHPIDRLLRERGLPERRLSLVASWTLCAELLARGERLSSVCAAQAAMLRRASPRLRCLPLPPDLAWPSLPLHLVWHQRTHPSKPHRWLRQRLREHLAAGAGAG